MSSVVITWHAATLILCRALHMGDGGGCGAG